MREAESNNKDCKRCSAIKNAKKALEVRRRKLTETQEAEVCTLYTQGAKTSELAKMFGIDQLTVQRTLHRYDIPMRAQKEEIRKYLTEEEKLEARRRTAGLWRDKNKDALRKKRQENGSCRLPYRLSKYGITFEEWKEVLESQDFTCPICGQPLEFQDRYPDTDHCHVTGKVRGILHNRCNRLLACAGDDVEILQNAIKYLERAKSMQRG